MIFDIYCSVSFPLAFNKKIEATGFQNLLILWSLLFVRIVPSNARSLQNLQVFLNENILHSHGGKS